jgi:nucleoside-diphosphate-sugar epimerase
VNVLITGGAGFIGSHLAEHLLARGERVVVVDDLSTGRLENIQPLRKQRGFRFVKARVAETRAMARLVDSADIIYHLAAAVGVQLIIQSPTRTIETNVRGAEAILELATGKRKRVLLASTSEVYGKRTQVPFREDDDLIMGPPDKARWSYACSKAIDEFLGVAYWKEKHVPTVIARLFNVIGPRQTGRYGMVVPNFIQQALAGRDITVFGDGSQRRCFCHVSDVVRGLRALAEERSIRGEVFNVGSTQEISIRELAEKIKAMTNSESKIVLVPYERAYEAGFEDMGRRLPDLTKIEHRLGYRPSVSLDDSLLDTIAYYRARQGTLKGKRAASH